MDNLNNFLNIKTTIEQLNAEAAIRQKKQDEHYNWLARQKYPLTLDNVKKDSAFKLSEMREAGIKFVSVLGCNNSGDDCDACLAMKGEKIEIEFATPLPLPGCDKKFCKCLYIAVE